MRNATTHTRVIAAFALVLATAALLAPAAVGKPTPRFYGQPNLQGSQLDRLPPRPTASVPDAFERAVAAQAQSATPDAFERAVARGPAGDTFVSGRDPGAPQPGLTSDDGGSFDWGLLVTLCAVAGGCLAVGAVAFTSVKERRRISTP
jgi:hypothetical protein